MGRIPILHGRGNLSFRLYTPWVGLNKPHAEFPICLTSLRMCGNNDDFWFENHLDIALFKACHLLTYAVWFLPSSCRLFTLHTTACAYCPIKRFIKLCKQISIKYAAGSASAPILQQLTWKGMDENCKASVNLMQILPIVSNIICLLRTEHTTYIINVPHRLVQYTQDVLTQRNKQSSKVLCNNVSINPPRCCEIKCPSIFEIPCSHVRNCHVDFGPKNWHAIGLALCVWTYKGKGNSHAGLDDKHLLHRPIGTRVLQDLRDSEPHRLSLPASTLESPIYLAGNSTMAVQRGLNMAKPRKAMQEIGWTV